MKKNQQAFDPSLEMLYAELFSASKQVKTNREVKKDPLAPSRYLFYLLNQPTNSSELMHQALDFIKFNLSEAEQIYSSAMSQDYLVNSLADLKVITIAALPEQHLNQTKLNECVNQSAAILLTQPCWLQNISQIACSQSSTAIQLMSIYLQLTQAEKGYADLTESYRSLLLTAGHLPPVLYSYQYSQQPEILTTMFDFATCQLALQRFPRVLCPEILGFTLAYCQMPTLIEICSPNQQLCSVFFKQRQQITQKQLPFLLSCIENYLAIFKPQKQILWQRIQTGFWCYQWHMQRCRDQFKTALEKPLSTNQLITKIFQKKVLAAIGHHQKIQLQGKSLDTWFAGMPENSQLLLQALKQSKYVDKQNPEESPLLKMFAFGGAMFGVLEPSEIAILKKLLQGKFDETSINFSAEKIKPQEQVKPMSVALNNQYAQLNNRELYYYLINADLFPDILPIAQKKLGKLLSYCKYFNKLPFKHYSHQQFESYLEAIYQREMHAYQPLQGKPKISKTAYKWGLEQMAPTILIDGCWLQNSLTVKNISPDIAQILCKIYADEIGNGQLEQNHSYIFQQLLDSLKIKLPPVASAEFVKHRRFINTAFDLPVYMLSLSHFSVEFLPELLGLNMAIEISGLGRYYLRLVEELNYWGIDPTIVKIHISIDNVASGHTLLAKKAIQLYMDEIKQRTGDCHLLDTHWRRIYNGYASLRLVSGWFRLSLPIWYLKNKSDLVETGLFKNIK